MQCTSGTADLWGWLGYNPTNNLAFSLISQAPNLKMFLGTWPRTPVEKLAP